MVHMDGRYDHGEKYIERWGSCDAGFSPLPDLPPKTTRRLLEPTCLLLKLLEGIYHLSYEDDDFAIEAFALCAILKHIGNLPPVCRVLLRKFFSCTLSCTHISRKFFFTPTSGEMDGLLREMRLYFELRTTRIDWEGFARRIDLQRLTSTWCSLDFTPGKRSLALISYFILNPSGRTSAEYEACNHHWYMHVFNLPGGFLPYFTEISNSAGQRSPTLPSSQVKRPAIPHPKLISERYNCILFLEGSGLNSRHAIILPPGFSDQATEPISQPQGRLGRSAAECLRIREL
ncbi:hypothetical protein C8R43DRAFT_959551 [Mycena crocata]|nr:hypothetical protein C8R43DRAFT_959551 [Mycena crocata]